MGERIATLYASDESLFTNAAQTYLAAITIGNTAPKSSGYYTRCCRVRSAI